MDVDGDHAVPLVDVGVDDGAQQHQARVVDQDVQPSGLCGDGGDGPFGLGAVADVGLHRESSAAGLLDVGDQGVEAVLAAGYDGDGCSVVSEVVTPWLWPPSTIAPRSYGLRIGSGPLFAYLAGAEAF